MNFWIFMICMIFAILSGMVLDRALIILARGNKKDIGTGSEQNYKNEISKKTFTESENDYQKRKDGGIHNN